jgi:hypothetical protein
MCAACVRACVRACACVRVCVSHLVFQTECAAKGKSGWVYWYVLQSAISCAREWTSVLVTSLGVPEVVALGAVGPFLVVDLDRHFVDSLPLATLGRHAQLPVESCVLGQSKQSRSSKGKSGGGREDGEHWGSVH